MKTKITNWTFFLFLIFFHVNFGYTQGNGLAADITHPTKSKKCKNGKIDLHILGGTPPYDVEWWLIPDDYEPVQYNTNIQGNNDGEDLSNAKEGTYKVIVSDALCRTATRTYELKCVECDKQCDIDGEVQNATCNEKGAITVYMMCADWHQPFTYKWSDGATTLDRTNLNPGKYCLTATDKYGCEFSQCFNVKKGAALEAVVAGKENVKFCGAPSGGQCNGSINIEVTNGNGGYTYEWSNGKTSQDVYSLCEGTYSVTISDQTGCSKVLETNICCCTGTNTSCGSSSSSPLTVKGITHSEGNFPYVDIEISGGTWDYACSWTGPNGFTSYDCWLSGNPLAYGTYTITVNDGCSKVQKSFNIVNCEEIEITANATVQETCDGMQVGNISLSPSGGKYPYTIYWENGSGTGNYIDGLAKGTYVAHIYDKNGCKSKPQTIIVGSHPPTITNSTIPCRRTTTCNGIDYVEDFSYNEFWACNTQYQTCPITGETVVTQHDWADVYVSNCVMYGVCQDGTQKILEYGASVSGPFLIEDRSCSTDFRCFDYACQFKNGLFIDESSSNYCSEILIFPNSPDCSKGECKMFVLCGNTKMGFFCSKCNSSGFKGSKAPQIPTRVFIKREDTILSVSLLKNDILDYANTYHKTTHTEIKLDLPMNTTGYQDVMIYPNPTDGNVTIDFKSKIDGLEIEIYDILGRLVYAKSFKEPTKKKTIDLGFLRDGIYLIHLLDSTHKIAIERLIIE